MTGERLKEMGFRGLVFRLNQDATLDFKNVALEIYYPGQGCVPDNTTIWIPNHSLLFAGYLVRPMEDLELGDVSGANMSEWPNTLRNLLEKYPDVETVIPGSGVWGGKNLIEHTLELLKK